MLAEPHVANNLPAHNIDAPVFIVTVAKLVRYKGEKHSPEKYETSQYLNVSNHSALGRKTEAEDDFSP